MINTTRIVRVEYELGKNDTYCIVIWRDSKVAQQSDFAEFVNLVCKTIGYTNAKVSILSASRRRLITDINDLQKEIRKGKSIFVRDHSKSKKHASDPDEELIEDFTKLNL